MLYVTGYFLNHEQNSDINNKLVQMNIGCVRTNTFVP